MHKRNHHKTRDSAPVPMANFRIKPPVLPEDLEQEVISGWPRRRLDSVRTWLRLKLGLDRAVGFTVLARGWSSLAGLMTVALIARFLSPHEQGYFYTFGSLIALQIVFELGFAFVILQMASHERAHLALFA